MHRLSALFAIIIVSIFIRSMWVQGEHNTHETIR